VISCTTPCLAVRVLDASRKEHQYLFRFELVVLGPDHPVIVGDERLMECVAGKEDPGYQEGRGRKQFGQEKIGLYRERNVLIHQNGDDVQRKVSRGYKHQQDYDVNDRFEFRQVSIQHGRGYKEQGHRSGKGKNYLSCPDSLIRK